MWRPRRGGRPERSRRDGLAKSSIADFHHSVLVGLLRILRLLRLIQSALPKAESRLILSIVPRLPILLRIQLPRTLQRGLIRSSKQSAAIGARIVDKL